MSVLPRVSFSMFLRFCSSSFVIVPVFASTLFAGLALLSLLKIFISKILCAQIWGVGRETAQKIKARTPGGSSYCAFVLFLLLPRNLLQFFSRYFSFFGHFMMSSTQAYQIAIIQPCVPIFHDRHNMMY